MKIVLIALIATIALLADARPARCAYCTSAPCINAQMCGLGCACLKPGNALKGQCYSFSESVPAGWSVMP